MPVHMSEKSRTQLREDASQDSPRRTRTQPREDASQDAPRSRYGAMLAVYLTGLLVGGLYVGMVAPVRTVVQQAFGIDDATGIWMINAYSLFYAALIPVIGKVADRRGRKLVFCACVGVFAAGSLMCGASAYAGGFGLLLAGRVVQAAGAGGMIPVANAQMGTAFPPERRGLALGLAAGVAGIANVMGGAVGSAVLGVVGTEGWGMLFFAAVPCCAAVLAGAVAFLPRDHAGDAAEKPLDAAGSAVFVLFVLCLLLGLRRIDFLDVSTLTSPQVLAPIVVAVLLGAVFGRVERRAADPVFHAEYLRNRQVVVTCAASFFIGCCIVNMMLVPQLAEFALGAPVGSGGYYILAVGASSLVGPPLGGKLIDRMGPKPVLMGGLGVMAAGFVFLALFVVPDPTPALLVAGLAVVGLGMGFAMGAPTNYMILANTPHEDAASAVATVALVRQIGTTVAPAVYVGFIGSAAGAAGYQAMLLCVAACSLAALSLTALYRDGTKADRAAG